MTPQARVFWGIIPLIAALSALLWYDDQRIQEQTRRDLEALKQAEQRLLGRAEQNGPRVAADQTRVSEAQVPIRKAAEKPEPAVWPRPSQALQQNPQLQAAYVAAKRANVATAYGPLFRKLHLSTHDAQALGELIMQREENAFDTAAAVPRVFTAMAEFNGDADTRLVINPYDAATYSAGRLPPDSMLPDEKTKAALTLLRQGIEDFSASATALLGQDKFNALQEYERTLPLQPEVREFAAVLALASQPLDMAQTEALSQALAQATPSYRRGGDAIPQSIDWDAATKALSSVLSPAQQDALRYRLAYARENMHFFRQFDKLSGSQ